MRKSTWIVFVLFAATLTGVPVVAYKTVVAAASILRGLIWTCMLFTNSSTVAFGFNPCMVLLKVKALVPVARVLRLW